MKSTRFFRGGIVALACSSMLSAQMAQAANPPGIPQSRQVAAAAPAIRDVALEGDGVFRGQIVGSQGVARPAIPVVMVRQGQEVARTETDQNGRFAVQGLTGGIYEVHTPVGSAMYRAWSPRTAPPAASPEALLIPDENVVRGQMRGGQALGWLANPWVLAGLVAAAIAIPLALDDDDAS